MDELVFLGLRLSHRSFKLAVMFLKTDNSLMHVLVIVYKLMERTLVFVNNRSQPLIFSPKSQNILTKFSDFFLIDCVLLTSSPLNLFLKDSSVLVVEGVLHLCVVDQLFNVLSGLSFVILVIFQIVGQLFIDQIKLFPQFLLLHILIKDYNRFSLSQMCKFANLLSQNLTLQCEIFFALFQFLHVPSTSTLQILYLCL